MSGDEYPIEAIPALLALAESPYDLFDLSDSKVNEIARELKRLGFGVTSQDLWRYFSYSAASIARGSRPKDFGREAQHALDVLPLRSSMRRVTRFDAFKHLYESFIVAFFEREKKELARYGI